MKKTSGKKKKNIEIINKKQKNFTTILKMFLGSRYKWGGKSYSGIDCSGILQIIFYYNNKFYPRDTKDQIKYLSKNIKIKIFKKGDIIFWKGHVAICINSKKLIHAYGPEKKVSQSTIKETIEKNDVVLFMKGTSSMPQCGFSSRIAGVLNFLNISWLDINVLAIN